MPGMQIVAIGNCQANAIAKRLQVAFRHHSDIRFASLASYRSFSEEDEALLSGADLLLAQVGSFPDEVIDAAAANARSVVTFPALSMNALWPLATQAHPDNRESLIWAGGPFPHQGGSRWINTLLARGVTPETAAAEFEAFDVASEYRVSRLLQVDIARWKSLEARCGIAFVDDLCARIPVERTFQAPLHPCGRTLEPIIDGIIRNSVLSHLSQAEWRGGPESFFRNQPPIHASIGTALNLSWLPDRFNLWDLGPITQREWVYRYVGYDAGADLSALMQTVRSTRQYADHHDALAAAVARHPASAPAHTALALSHLARGALDEAAYHAEQAHMLWPDVTEAIFVKAKIEARKGDWSAADATSTQLLAGNPWHQGGLLMSVRAKLQMKDHEGAWRAIMTAMEAKPGSKPVAEMLEKVKAASAAPRRAAA